MADTNAEYAGQILTGEDGREIPHGQGFMSVRMDDGDTVELRGLFKRGKLAEGSKTWFHAGQNRPFIVFRGHFDEDGQIQGHGSVTTEDFTYTGNFTDNMLQGPVTRTLIDGSQRTEKYFKDGVPFNGITSRDRTTKPGGEGDPVAGGRKRFHRRQTYKRKLHSHKNRRRAKSCRRRRHSSSSRQKRHKRTI